MLFLYRALLHFYPAAFRFEYGDEMLSVFRDVRGETCRRNQMQRAEFYIREIAGLLRGAVREHARSVSAFHCWTLVSSRSFNMRSEFRFPKSTAVLMMIILAGIVLAIEKAEAIQASLPHVNPPVGPIQPAHFTLVPTFALMFLAVYAAAALGWALLFALRRSGVHRLSQFKL